MTNHSYQQCTRCVMDTTATEITFDDQGVCNFCTEFLNKSSHIVFEDAEEKKRRLNQLVEKVKSQGIGKEYDCVVGVSGGVDSSWTLVKAMELGLRPIAVHMDNGWNSELAQNNIANLVNGLGIDLYTHVIDWNEYRALMQAFFDADVLDVELLYDNAMMAVCYQQARKFGIKSILSGSNQVTEGLRIPDGWNWYKRDVRNIKALGKQFGNVKIDTFPTHTTIDFIKDEIIRSIHWISFLDYLPYNKYEALDVLENQFGYKRYPYKHYESIFTRFYQGYILPEKFNVDKRLVHLSTLIISGQLTRAEALEQLEGTPYPSKEALESDIDYFLKKMGWTKKDLKDYIERPETRHDDYPSERPLFQIMNSIPLSLKSNLKKWLLG